MAESSNQDNIDQITVETNDEVTSSPEDITAQHTGTSEQREHNFSNSL